MTPFTDTIAAVSTAPGQGAIAVVRMSGSDAFAIARKIFRSRRATNDTSEAVEFKSNQALYGTVVNSTTGDPLDEVVLVPFKAPHTYTGEDLVEISCHGSPVIASEVLSHLLNLGARLARPGEFTQRAFLSGRIDLTQAEAVLDLIQAKTAHQGRRSLSALQGALGEPINKVRNDLVALLTRIVAGLDFPEEIGDAPEPEIEIVIAESLRTLDDLARRVRTGKYLREGLKLAIVGRPNAGKSSLLNQLLKYERAIVTEIPGTTRDSLEEMLDLNGIPILLIDTAGIHPTEDKVEKIGIERSKQAMAQCDLALLVTDVTQAWGEPEIKIAEMLGDCSFILAGNKIDLLSTGTLDAHQPGSNCFAKVGISAKTGQNIDELTQSIERFVFHNDPKRDEPSLNERQAELCLKAINALKLVEQTLKGQYPQDCLATDLKSAVDALSEISGQSVSEEVITSVFATFCIGK